MKKLLFYFIFIILTSSFVFAVVPGDECSVDSDCPNSECDVISSVCNNGYCVFEKKGTKTCSDFEGSICGDNVCEDEDKRCPRDCVKIMPKTIPLNPGFEHRNINTECKESEITFEVVNNDPNHKLEGFLSCSIPDDVNVWGCTSCSTVGAVIKTEEFLLDSVSMSKSLNFRFTSKSEGEKEVKCTLNYVSFIEDKGYYSEELERYRSVKEYSQVSESIEIGCPLPPEPTFWEKIVLKLKEFVNSPYFFVIVALLILFSFVVFELKKNTFISKRGYKYFRIRKKSFPKKFIAKFNKDLGEHHPLSLKTKRFHYKDENYHYFIIKNIFGTSYYRRRKNAKPVKLPNFRRGSSSEKFLEFLIWFVTLTFGFWIAKTLTDYLNIEYLFLNFIIIGVVVESVSNIMQAFRYNKRIRVFDMKFFERSLFWSLLHSIAYLGVLFLLNHFGIVHPLLVIVLIGLGITLLAQFVWKTNLDREDHWILAIVISLLVILYFTNGFSDVKLIFENIMENSS